MTALIGIVGVVVGAAVPLFVAYRVEGHRRQQQLVTDALRELFEANARLLWESDELEQRRLHATIAAGKSQVLLVGSRRSADIIDQMQSEVDLSSEDGQMLFVTLLNQLRNETLGSQDELPPELWLRALFGTEGRMGF